MSTLFETTEAGGLADAIISAIPDLSIDDLINVANTTLPDKIAFNLGSGDIGLITVEALEKWAVEANFDLHKSDDLPDAPYVYEFEGSLSDNSFATPEEAMLDAFELSLTN
jgi:hypothetical protein